MSETVVPTPDLYLVRHGRTALNARGVLRGRLDVPLDDIGRLQAARLGELFAAVPLQLVVTSPLGRACETARCIADAAGAPLREDVRLVDRDYGRWSGRPEDDVVGRYGSLNETPHIEPTSRLAGRVRAAFEEWTMQLSGPLVFVAHDAVNQTLLALIGVADPIAQPPGCWNLVSAEGNGWVGRVVGAVPGDGAVP